MSKKHFLVSLAVVVAFFILSIALPMIPVLYVDPLHVLSDYDEEENYFYHNLRWALPGVIRHHMEYKKDVRNIVLGSSVTLDAMPVDMEKFGRMPDGLTLSLLSLQADEVVTLVQVLSRYDQLENIIFSFDSGQYFRPGTSKNHDFPTDLYTGTLTDKLKSMRNMDIIKYAWSILRGEASTTTYDYLRVSMPKRCANQLFTKFQVEEFDNLLKTSEETQERLRNPEPYTVDVDEFISYYQILDALLMLPETVTVHVFLSPALVNQGFNSTEFPFYKAGILRMLEDIATRPNIILYGFDDVPQIVNNVSNFLDPTHYGIGVMRYILQAIGEGRHIITTDNVDEYLARSYENRLNSRIHIDNDHTVAFEGPLDEDLFSAYPPPYGPELFRSNDS